MSCTPSSVKDAPSTDSTNLRVGLDSNAFHFYFLFCAKPGVSQHHQQSNTIQFNSTDIDSYPPKSPYPSPSPYPKHIFVGPVHVQSANLNRGCIRKFKGNDIRSLTLSEIVPDRWSRCCCCCAVSIRKDICQNTAGLGVVERRHKG